MSGHTRGPWRMNAERGIVFDRRTYSVANVYPRNRPANTALISAAPDMLAELERLLDVVGEADAAITEAVINRAKGETE